MTIIGIDPGTENSGVVIWDGSRVTHCWPAMANALVRALLTGFRPDSYRVVCEWIQAMGMPCGQEVFLTCRHIGRMEETWAHQGGTMEFIQRPTVKTRLCGTPRAKDPNVRQALIDRLGPVGTKNNPGPLYGVSSHAWSALAVAIAIDLK